MAEAVVVGVRVRPFNEREKNLEATCCIDMDGQKTTIRNASQETKDFTFDESFWSHDGMEDDGTGYMKASSGSQYADQRYVYETFGERVLNNAWKGFHCCLFAYGQTGSGKSYSMVGYGKNKGIVPISCEEIFLRIASSQPGNADESLHFEVTVSMVEIYNEAVQDLLIEPEDRPRKGLEVRESKLLGIYIDGVTKRPVSDYPHIEATIDEAVNHRTIGSTLMNATSSRAHTVQIIEFKQIVKMAGRKDQVRVSMINLVDLAGSEKAGQTGATGDRLKEGAAINKSLSALGNVIEKLAQRSQQATNSKKPVIIPYRDSKLTRLLQNALGGSSKTIMVCALSPASSNYEETLSTLRYADRAKKIKNNAVVNENPQDTLVRELKEENAKLREMMGKMGNGVDLDGPSVKDFEQMKEQRKKILDGQAALDEMEKDFNLRLEEDKVRQSQHLLAQENQRPTMTSMTQRCAGPQTKGPLLINLNADPQLAGRMRYNLDEGVIVHVGNYDPHKQGDSDSDSSSSSSSGSSSSDSEEDTPPPEICLQGDSMYEKHAYLLNTGGEIRLYSDGEAGEHSFVNGHSIWELLEKRKEAESKSKKLLASGRSPSFLAGIFGGGQAEPAAEDVDSDAEGPKPTDLDIAGGVKLNHGDRVVFGDACFFYCDSAIEQPEIMMVRGDVSHVNATTEVTNSVAGLWHTGANRLKTLKNLKTKLESATDEVVVRKLRADLKEQIAANEEAAKKHEEEAAALREEVELRSILCTEASAEIHTLKEQAQEKDRTFQGAKTKLEEDLAKQDKELGKAVAKHAAELTTLKETEAKVQKDLAEQLLASESSAMKASSEAHGKELANRDAELQAAAAKHTSEHAELKENEVKLRKDFADQVAASESNNLEKSNQLHTEELERRDAELKKALEAHGVQLAKLKEELLGEQAQAMASTEAKHTSEHAELKENEAKLRKDFAAQISTLESNGIEKGNQLHTEELGKRDEELRAAVAKHAAELTTLKETEAKVQKDLVEQHSAYKSSAMKASSEAHAKELAKRDAELQAAAAKHTSERAELKENEAKLRKDFADQVSAIESNDMEKSNQLHTEELERRDAELKKALGTHGVQLAKLKEDLLEEQAQAVASNEAKHTSAHAELKENEAKLLKAAASNEAKLQEDLAQDHTKSQEELMKQHAEALAKLKDELRKEQVSSSQEVAKYKALSEQAKPRTVHQQDTEESKRIPLGRQSVISADQARNKLAESMKGTFTEAVKALDLVETTLTDLVSKREKKRKAVEYPMF